MARGKLNVPRAKAIEAGRATYLGAVCSVCDSEVRRVYDNRCYSCIVTAKTDPVRIAEIKQRRLEGIQAHWAEQRAKKPRSTKVVPLRKHDDDFDDGRHYRPNSLFSPEAFTNRMDGVRYENGVRIFERPPVNYGRENEYPDAYPYNVTMRPPMSSYNPSHHIMSSRQDHRPPTRPTPTF